MQDVMLRRIAHVDIFKSKNFKEILCNNLRCKAVILKK